MAWITDDLGTAMEVASSRRVVSLVPSLTESIATSSAASYLVGATDWCTHPADLAVTRVRGTKNPDLAAIRALQPELVVANKEENREFDVRRLRASGTAVWVTDIRSVDGALTSLRRLFTEALTVETPSWLDQAEEVWAQPTALRRRVVIPIWRDPWMVVGSETFTGDLAARLGLGNVFADSPDRYPHVSLDQIAEADPEVVVLPDEPYVFTETDGPEAFPDLPCALVSGRLLTWYGPSLVQARRELVASLNP
ncbi:MAG TPA: helical backbone metal receptor [Jatrophihabitans sp.]|jgi:ABC-type Fe3+-hydroxamate transport system substrate-binding protein